MNIQKLKTEMAKNRTVKNIIFFDSISSTNDYAKQNHKKLKHGTVILADEQTNGRGRRENKWFSPKGKGLYFSVLLKSRKGALQYAPTILNIIPAYAVLKALEEEYGIKGCMKYPNDILINGKKVGGILVETKFSCKDRSRPVLIYAVIGIGLNVNGKPSDFPVELRKSSAFISQFVKKVVTGRDLSLQIIKNLNILYVRGQGFL